MTIIKLDTRKKKAVTLVLDNGQQIEISKEEFLRSKIQKGSSVSPQQVKNMSALYEIDKAKDKALYFISVRSHSSGELRQKLLRNFSDEIIEEVCRWLEDRGYLNDETYAERCANLLLEEKAYSRSRIFLELRKRFISSDLAEKIVSELPEEKIKANLVKIISNKFAEIYDNQDKRNRLINKLQRLGYGYNEITSTIDEQEKFHKTNTRDYRLL